MLLTMEEFTAEQQEEAEARRRAIEESKPAHIEVVILQGNTLQDLERTHARYFASLEEIAKSAAPGS